MHQLATAVCFCLLAPAAWAWELDQQPAKPGEWNFRPDAGAPVEVNPPSFTWRPEEDATAYQLQVADDDALRNLVYEADTRWSSHCPPITLPSGQLFWRYRAIGADGVASEWSVTRPFSISSDASNHPQPTLADLRSRLSDPRPRSFMRSNNLDHYRRLARGDLAHQWEAIRSVADALIVNPPDVSEPPKYPKGVSRKGGAGKKIWWGNRLRAIAVADGAATLAFAYRLSGDERYGRAARDLLLALTEWDPDGATSFAYNDEAAMPILYMASRAYDWAHPVLNAEDRARFIAMQRARGKQCFDYLLGRDHLWKPYGSHQNRAWHMLAELSTAFIDEIPEAEAWLDYSMTVYFTCYPVWDDSDGGWHEGLAYWNSYISRFTQWAMVMQQAYQIDAFERPYFERAGYLPMYLMPPGTTHGGFGDLAPRLTSKSCSGLVNVLASGAANPHWKWYAEQHDADYPNTYVGFFSAAQARDLTPTPPAGLPSSALFAGTGVAALNTDIVNADNNVQVLFKSSPFGKISHGYNAQNAFQLSANGHPLLQNTGDRDAYGSPHHKQWMRHAQSQNVILVDGQGSSDDAYAATGRITHFRTSEKMDVVVGEAGDGYPALDRWSRRIIFLKPNVIVLHDVLQAKRPATFQFLLHAPVRFDLDQVGRGSVRTDYGSVEFAFLHPPGLEVSQTDIYEPPPAAWSGLDLGEWHLTAATKIRSQRQHFVSVFRVNGQKAAVTSREIDSGHEVEINIHDARFRLRCEDHRLDVRCGAAVHWEFVDSASAATGADRRR